LSYFLHTYCLYLLIIQKSQAVRNMCGPQKARVKKDMKSKVEAKKWLWSYVYGKNLMITIQVNLCASFTRTWHQIKFLPLTYYHSYFLAAILDFSSFTLHFWGLHLFFAWLFLYRYMYHAPLFDRICTNIHEDLTIIVFISNASNWICEKECCQTKYDQ